MADQSQETQQAPQSPESVNSADTSEIQANVAAKRAAADAKRAAILQAAREKMRSEFRSAQGVAEPVKAAPAEAPAKVEAAAPTQNANNVAQAITAQLQNQFEEAAKLRSEADKVRAESEARAAAAEAKLQKFLANPISFLEDQKLSPDAWQARLLNGGTPTEQERLKAEMTAQIEQGKKETLGEVSKIKQELVAEKRTRAISDLTPILQKQFPLVNRLLGAESALEHMKSEAQRTGKLIDAQAFLQKIENDFVEQYQATLRDEGIANKLGLSVKSPNVEVADIPRTLSNRVTSSVAPATSRPRTERERIAQGRLKIQQLRAEGKL